jgi:mannitol/fructose-specific phosphotransferase system IIA component (Ntr-type)
MTEEVLQQQFFMAKLTGKTTFKSLEKQPSPQKHMLRNPSVSSSEDEYETYLSKQQKTDELIEI